MPLQPVENKRTAREARAARMNSALTTDHLLDTLGRYHVEVPPTASFPAPEAALWQAWQSARDRG